MTSFSPLPEPRRPAGSPAGDWRTGPEEDWHTGSRPAIPAISVTPVTPVPQPPPVGQQPLVSQQPPAPQRPSIPEPRRPPAPAAPVRGPAAPVRDGDEAWAMLSYLGIPFVSILAPLAVFLIRGRSSGYVRQHATQALNLSITIVLYNICALIVAGMLALDAIGAALAVAVPVALVLWLVALAYLMRAAARASLGEFYQLPRWICATIAR